MKQPSSHRIGRALLAALALGFAATSAALAADGTRYYVNDHLATTVGIADAAGEIAALEADAFGSPLAGGSNAGRFTGKPYDEDLGAYVFPFRNYRADEARWMSADPSGFPDGVNARLYAASPLLKLDPLGLAVTFGSYVDSNGVTHSVSPEQQQQFHTTMQQMATQGPEGQMVYDAVYGSETNINVINTPGEIPTGAGGVINGTQTGSVGLDFSQASFIDPSLAGPYADQIGSAVGVLAHELGHAVYNFTDPGNVVWENYFRPQDDQRTHYRDIEITPEMITNMRNTISNLVRAHQE